MRLPSAGLEDWMRDHYFSTELDLGSSGVPCWSLGELRRRFGFGDTLDLDALDLDDTPTLGTDELRSAVAQRCGNGDPSRVMITHGSSEAIFLVLNALLSDGDEILVVEPAYHSLRSVAAAVGCRIRPWPLISEAGIGADLDALEAMVGPRTAAVVVNFPHNPTGLSLTLADQRRLIDIARRSDAYLLWDNAFAELTYDLPALPDPSQSYHRCIATGTMSKAYGLPGLRTGWVLAAPHLLERLIPMRDALTLSLSPLVQRIAARVLGSADAIVGARLMAAAQNRALLASWAGANPELVDYRPADGGVTAFPRFRSIRDTRRLCQDLHEDAGVLLIPGSCFGEPDRVRLGFGADTATFARGLRLLTDQLRLVEAR